MPTVAPDPTIDPAAIAHNIASLRVEIAAAAREAGRDAPSVVLVAVSKTWPRAAIDAAIDAGQMTFGENRVQEAAGKFAPAPSQEHSGAADVAVGTRTRPRLHLIGPLQTNKARDAVRLADVIESLDRPRLADALEEAIAREGRSPDLLIQVNVGREPQKAGVAPEDADGFIAQCCARFGERLRGLMCVPPASGDPTPHFRHLAELAERHGLPVLSMGMSADFAIAIRCGATWVRIGSAVFGGRR